ncbi:radical SAM protein [Candidatus Pacearchaeota archaeon]|nr:radical SAM protein [Candidatus Pacearchaeota archaeon]
MAVGFLGSNGEIEKGKNFAKVDLLNRPLEVSYFVNNLCNLNCKHCYVGYSNPNDDLSIQEWKNTFDELIDLGALTFGNVGREPLLAWEKTSGLLKYFQDKKAKNPKLRYGLVTNATLFNEEKIKRLNELNPDYLDISIDGTEQIHDFIRGKGNYQRAYKNLQEIKETAPNLLNKIFISYTLMQPNKNTLKETIQEMNQLGINNFLISPYVKTIHDEGNLGLDNSEIADIYENIKIGNTVDFSKTKNLEILLKSDYDTQKDLMDLLVKRKIINVDNLLIDEYGVIFNKEEKENNSKIILNFIPIPETLTRAIRISHDGYVGGCEEMFHENYPELTVGNIKEKSITEILGNKNP